MQMDSCTPDERGALNIYIFDVFFGIFSSGVILRGIIARNLSAPQFMRIFAGLPFNNADVFGVKNPVSYFFRYVR